MSDLYPTLSLGEQTPVPNDLDQNIIVPPLKSFSQWSASSGSEINDPMLSAQGYADYQRGHFFRTGELNDEVEGSITQGLVGSLLNNGLVTEEEVQAEGFLSTLKPESDVQTKTNLIRMAYGEEAGSIYNNNIQSDSANTEELDKQLNRAKTLLVESGNLPFARITDDKGVQKVIGGVGIENRGEALDTAVRLGGLDYSDAYRVMSGLEKRSGDTSTAFENIRQAQLLTELTDIFGSEDEQDEAANNALDNMRELIKQKDIKPDLDQEADISGIVSDMRKSLSSSYSRRTGFGEGAALNRFSDKEIKDTIELLAANEVNEKGEFKLYDEDAKNIRILGSGHVLAHPALMQQKERFERAVKSDKRLSPAQATSLRNQRKLYRELTYEQYDKFLSETAATSDDWMAAKQAGRVKGLKDTDVLDSFVADNRNYSSIKNRLGDIAATIPDAVIGMFASLGAMVFKSERATNYLVENQMDRQRRREVASIFGDDFGWGMDLSNIVAPMIVDVSATTFLSATTLGAGGVAYAATKTTATSAAKLAVKKLTSSFVRKQFGDAARTSVKATALRRSLNESGDLASKNGVQAALKEYNKAVANRMFRKSVAYPSMFLPAANREAGSTYATVYAAQPDNMTHEEKHDAALGYAMMAGTVTGLITTAFMGLGRGGFEKEFLNGLSSKGLNAGLQKLTNLNIVGRGAAEIKKEIADVVSKKLSTSLKDRIGSNLKAFGIPARDEALEEGLDEFVQTFIMDAALNEDTPMVERMMTGLHAASLGGAMGAGVVGVRRMIDRGRGSQYEQFQEQNINNLINELEATGSPLTKQFIESNKPDILRQLRTASRSREDLNVSFDPQQELNFDEGVTTAPERDEVSVGEARRSASSAGVASQQLDLFDQPAQEGQMDFIEDLLGNKVSKEDARQQIEDALASINTDFVRSASEELEFRESQAGGIEGLEKERLDKVRQQKFEDSFDNLWIDKEESEVLGQGLSAKEHYQRFEKARIEAVKVAEFWGMETRIDYNENNKARGAFRAERLQDGTGMRLVMNPWGMSRLTMGLNEGNAQHVSRFEAAHEVIHHAAWRSLSKAELDEIFSVLTPTQVNEIIDTYYDNEEKRVNARNLLTPDASPSRRRNMQHIIVDEFLRMKAQKLTKGYTSEEEIEFYKSNPNFVRVFLRYLGSYLNRFKAIRERDGENPVVAAAINRLTGEMAALRGGYAITSTVKFDVNDPEGTIRILAQYLDDRPFTNDPNERLNFGDRETQAGAINNKGGQRGGLESGELDTELGGIEYGSYAPLFQIAMYEEGPYRKKMDGMWSWLNAFRGDVDPRVKRVLQQRQQIREAVANDVEKFSINLKKIVKEDFKDNPPAELIRTIIGDRNNISPETDNAFMKSIEGNTPAQIKAKREAYVADKQKEFNDRKAAAVKELAKLQNVDPNQGNDTRLMKHLNSLRELTTQLSKEIRRIVKEDSEMGIAIGDNLEIYIHRKYRLFSEKEYRDNIRNHPDYESVRNDAGDYLFKEYVRLHKDWQNNDRNISDKTEFKKQLVNDYLDVFIKGENNTSKNNLINNLKGHRKSIITLDIGALKTRKNPPQELRELLGEITDSEKGYGDLVRTFQHLGLIASQLNFINNLKELGLNNGFIISAGKKIDTTAEGKDIYERDAEFEGSKEFEELVIQKGEDINLINAAPFADGKKYYVLKEMQSALSAMLNPQTQIDPTEAQKANEFLIKIGAKLTGLSLGAKTLGSIGFYVRNVFSNMLFFGPAQGFWKLGMMSKSLQQEFIRKKYLSMSPEEVSAFHRTVGGMLGFGQDINARLIQDLLENPPSEAQLQQELLNVVNEIEEATGEKPSLDIDVLSKKVGDSRLGKLYARLRDLSQTVDTFFRISAFMFELDYLQKARKYDQDNPPSKDVKSRSYANYSDSQLMQEAADIIKKTQQNYSEAPPFVQKMQGNWFGVMFAPFIRFKVEVPRIVLNTIPQIKKEMQHHNPVIKKRGKERLIGMTTVITAFSAGIGGILNAIAGIGEEEDEALRDSMPEYLRTHSFIYFGKGDKLKSVDLTYVNPFAMVVDPFLRAFEKIWRGSPAEGGAAFFKTLVADQYLDQQILAGAVTSALNNRDPETGRPITEANDTAWEAFTKKFQFMFAEAYMPRTPDNLIENGIRKLSEGDPDAIDFVLTPAGALAMEFLPFKPHDVSLEKQFDRFLSERAGEYRRAVATKNTMYTDRNLPEGTVRKLADSEIERRRRINAHLLRTMRGFESLGLTKEQIYSQATERGYGKRRMALLLNGLMERPALQTPFIRNMAVKGDLHIERLRTFQNQLENYDRYIPVE